MSRFQLNALRGLCCAFGLSALALASSGCAVGVDSDYPPGEYPAGYYDGYPPDAYIATAEPYYFEGHATYWYGGRWYFRDGNRWNHYDHEPSGLYQHRIGGPVVRRSYEPYRGHAVARPSSHGGGHGHR
jgi:hypothetical protein